MFQSKEQHHPERQKTMEKAGANPEFELLLPARKWF
jgi:hypothetical protein